MKLKPYWLEQELTVCRRSAVSSCKHTHREHSKVTRLRQSVLTGRKEKQIIAKFLAIHEQNVRGKKLLPQQLTQVTEIAEAGIAHTQDTHTLWISFVAYLPVTGVTHERWERLPRYTWDVDDVLNK